MTQDMGISYIGWPQDRSGIQKQQILGTPIKIFLFYGNPISGRLQPSAAASILWAIKLLSSRLPLVHIVLQSKLLVSPLICPIVVPYIIPYIIPYRTPFKEFRL